MGPLDLTRPLVAGMPVYPGDPEVATTPVASVAADGAAVTHLRCGTHSGTHVDAPAHVRGDGAAVDEVALDRFCGPLRLVRFSGLPARARVGAREVAARLGSAGAGDVVVLDLGWADRFDTPAVTEHPWRDADVADLLLDRGVRTVGVDTLSPDPTGGPPGHGFPFHERWSAAGGVIYENLVPGVVPDDGAERFFTGWPLRLRGLDGSPVRAVVLPGRRS
ncbi:cyclase family protein [Kineococcus gynurae]|uniref:Cyclase family protein n=1 Tax=Kineococcus gynurae TaxID=452979 RepID=A0ABV5LX84_9ACTN